MNKYIGVSDEVLTCHQCGRSVKKTIVIENESGHINYYGSECATNILKLSKKELTKQVNSTLKQKKKEQEELIKKARYQYYKHPNIVKVNAEIQECNKLNIPFAERKHFFANWSLLQREAKEEIIKRFNLPSDTQLI